MESSNVWGVINTILPILKGVALALLILVLGWLVGKWTNRLVLSSFRTRKLDEALARFLGGIAQYTVLAAAVVSALGTVGIQTTSIMAILASAGLAVGLALQGSLSNFASGVMILFFRPFNLGDKINAAGHTGDVEDIGIFTTTIITLDNEKIIIPNSAIISGSITNYTVRGTLRGCIDVGVAYGSKIEEVIPVLQRAAEQADLVLEDPAPNIAFVGLGASSLDFKVFAWCKPVDYLDMLHNVRISVYDELNAAGIEIPFTQIVVHQSDAA